MPRPTSLIFLTFTILLTLFPESSRAEDAPPWVDSMKTAHSRFSGRKGSFAQFGDSITDTQAYWSPLQWQKKNMDADTQKAFDAVKAYMNADCWGWKGEKFGNESGKTIAWADDHIDQWLKDLNPETVLIMFGTNDLAQVPIDQYEAKLRDVIQKCLKNGTIVILSTIPPKHGMLDKARQYAEVDRKVADEMKLPLIDFFGEILKRRPDDWDGADPKMKTPANGYDAETLLGGDGVHPSYPTKYQGDYSEEGLKHCGYGLRTYLTLRMYNRVIGSVLKVNVGREGSERTRICSTDMVTKVTMPKRFAISRSRLFSYYCRS